MFFFNLSKNGGEHTAFKLEFNSCVRTSANQSVPCVSDCPRVHQCALSRVILCIN